MATYPITEAQAHFLNELSRAASDYRKAANALKLVIPERISYMARGWEPSELPLDKMVKAEARYCALWSVSGTTLISLGMSADDADKYVALAATEDEDAFHGKHFFMAKDRAK